MKLDVIFRSCSEVTAVHGNGRPFGASKAEVLRRCLASLIGSLGEAIRDGAAASVKLTVIDDHSSESCLRDIGSLLGASPFASEIHHLSERGNGPSMAACFHWAKANVSEVFYLVEDDYLHQRSAISEMIEAYQRAAGLVPGRDPVIFPCDYPDRYTAPYPSKVFLGSRRYWRTVMHTTGTFMTSRRNLDRYWQNYIAFSSYGLDPEISEATTINQIYTDSPCLSPMPSLTKHMHEGLDSPFVAWTEWWNEGASAETFPLTGTDLGSPQVPVP